MSYPNDEYESPQVERLQFVPIGQFLREQARAQAYQDLLEMNRTCGVYDAWILTPQDERFLKGLRIKP
jgi:hypothetical protein